MTLSATLIVGGYFLFFLASVFAMLWWLRRQRKMRHPFDQDLKLLRMPGETQFKLITEFDENFFVILIFVAFVPMVAGTVALATLTRIGGWGAVVGIGVSAVLFIVTFILCARWVSRRMLGRFNRYLGYFGERVVAEALEPLKLRGWRVFHDVPCEAGTARFNIDHVAIGPWGVFAIETKSRRKGQPREGRRDHEVSFNGNVLSWPWAESRDEIEQALGNAKWLQKRLAERTGENPQVAAVLTIPGWMVIEKARGPLRVVNPKFLPEVLASRRDALTEKQIDLYSRYLELLCRTVEY